MHTCTVKVWVTVNDALRVYVNWWSGQRLQQFVPKSRRKGTATKQETLVRIIDMVAYFVSSRCRAQFLFLHARIPPSQSRRTGKTSLTNILSYKGIHETDSWHGFMQCTCMNRVSCASNTAFLSFRLASCSSTSLQVGLINEYVCRILECHHSGGVWMILSNGRAFIGRLTLQPGLKTSCLPHKVCWLEHYCAWRKVFPADCIKLTK